MASGTIKTFGRTLITSATFKGLSIKVYRFMPYLYVVNVGGKTTETLPTSWANANVKTGVVTPEKLQSAQATFFAEGTGVTVRITDGGVLQLVAAGTIAVDKWVNGIVIITP